MVWKKQNKPAPDNMFPQGDAPLGTRSMADIMKNPVGKFKLDLPTKMKVGLRKMRKPTVPKAV